MGSYNHVLQKTFVRSNHIHIFISIVFVKTYPFNLHTAPLQNVYLGGGLWPGCLCLKSEGSLIKIGLCFYVLFDCTFLSEKTELLSVNYNERLIFFVLPIS